MYHIKETILFVDDEKSILDIATEYFQHKGYEIVTANNGLEAVKILEKQEVDCCFTDINMPIMDGLQLAEHIHKTDNTIPVIIMTGYPSMENTLKTLKNGVVDFLVKPVNLNQMEICLRRVLRERQLFVENILLKKEIESKSRLQKLNNELVIKIEELHVLNKIMKDFTTIGSTSNAFNRVVNTALEVTYADEAIFFIVNDAIKEPFEVAGALCSNSIFRVQGIANQPPSANGKKSQNGENQFSQIIKELVMEVAVDQIPLLITNNNGTHNLPKEILSLAVLPLKIREKVFGVLFAATYSGEKRFSERDLYYLSYMTQNAAHAIENLALYENIYENLFSTLYAFVKAIEFRDPYTQQHSNRVTGIALAIGKEMGCSKEELDVLNFAGRLHDIGKIGIRDEILLKPERLTPEEFEKIKEHPTIGANIIGQLGLWDQEKSIIHSHHERFDGKGYPDGLKGENIPFLARILSVSDVYDAIASDRAYRRRMDENKIVNIIKEGRGTQFDPLIVDTFFKLYYAGRFEKTHGPNAGSAEPTIDLFE